MQNKIRKMAIAMISMLFAFVATAGSNDAALLFSTRGPDRYADNTPVQVGEMYALVWMRNGSEFKGIDMNGKPVDATNNAVVVALPLGKYSKRCKGVHCPSTLFQIDASFAESHADGTFALALLDTRVSDGKGGLVPSGRIDQVKGWGLVEKSRVKAMGGAFVSATNSGDAEGRAQTTQTSEVPEGEDIPQPKITGIRLEGDYVVLTVTGTSPRLLYNVASGAQPGRFANRHAAHAAVPGHTNRNREITIISPRVEGQNFFKVVRN